MSFLRGAKLTPGTESGGDTASETVVVIDNKVEVQIHI